jgi:histone H3/H4
MSRKHVEAFVEEKTRKFEMKIGKPAKKKLSKIIDELCEHILHGAEKIRKFAKKKEIDCEAVEVAAHVNIRSKELRALRKI